jgi:diguanylate cyclase (GGDEF)-like protein
MPVNRAPIIGVLTPFTGGFYYGAAMAGIERIAEARGATVVVLQTTGLAVAAPDAPDAEYLALEAADGWLAVNQFGVPGFTARIRARGVPVVHVHSRPDSARGCAVLPDNQSTMRAAVSHLVEHGHRRIAFAGCLGQVDLRERYQAYLAALDEAGLVVDPALLFESAANFETDGELIAPRILATDPACTAVVAGTDRLALGLLTAFRAAGVVVPKDLALVGFDDIEQSQLVDPPLTTVRQNFGLVSATATTKLLDHLLDGTPLPSVVRVPTTFVRRQSCGCRPAYTTNLPPPPLPNAEDAEAELAAALREVALPERQGVGRQEWPGARAIAALLGRVRRGEAALDDEDLNLLWSDFLKGQRDAASIDHLLTVLEGHVERWPTDAREERALATALRQLRVALIRNWRRLEIDRNRFFESVAESNAKINHALATWRPNEGMDLSWLRWTRASYACLGLWSERAEGAPRSLRIVGEYLGDTAAEGLAGTSHEPSHFPPRRASGLACGPGKRHVFTIVPVTSGVVDRGVLAIATPIEVELVDRVGNPSEWATQVGAALERAEIDQQLRKHAFYDALTGLPNRAFLLERTEALVSSPAGPTVAVLSLDLDDFKKINDSKGHSAGDHLLVEIADRLERAVSGAGTVARLGGDEFGICIQCADVQRDVLAQVGAIKAALREPFTLEGEVVFTSCSIGVAVSGPESASAASLLRDADIARSRAKLAGPGGYEHFHHGMHAQAVERLRLDSRLRQALEREEFALVYQPIISLTSGRPVSAEALIRWHHPEQGFLSPARFMAVADDVGLSIPIGRWALETACQTAKGWQRPDAAPVYVSVNVSAEHLLSPGFVEFVEGLLLKYSLSPQALGLELVERSLAHEKSLTTRVLGRLLDLGVKVAIDDFGTGYSSLAQLKRFPIDTLKVDRSFIRELPRDSEDKAIAEAIIAMGKTLSLTVVAEGVETHEQQEFLRARACDQTQGFFFSKPIAAAEFAELLRTHRR